MEPRLAHDIAHGIFDRWTAEQLERFGTSQSLDLCYEMVCKATEHEPGINLDKRRKVMSKLMMWLDPDRNDDWAGYQPNSDRADYTDDADAGMF